MDQPLSPTFREWLRSVQAKQKQRSGPFLDARLPEAHSMMENVAFDPFDDPAEWPEEIRREVIKRQAEIRAFNREVLRKRWLKPLLHAAADSQNKRGNSNAQTMSGGRPDESVRNLEIFKLRLSGMTLTALGCKFGITGQRVRQICLKMSKKNHARGHRSAIVSAFKPEIASRPIDMGGEREVWINSTPEDQYREFCESYGVSLR